MNREDTAPDNSTDNLDVRVTPWQNEAGFEGVQHLSYIGQGGLNDWALLLPGPSRTYVIAIHGHGSTGDQIFTRPDIRDLWLATYRRFGLGVLSVNLRGNAWMNPDAVDDLHRLLPWVRSRYDVGDFLFISGSMGGTSNLIYACRHPEDVAAMVALCPATDIGRYANWCAEHRTGVVTEIYGAICQAYGGPPEEQPRRYHAHSALLHTNRLTMPVYVSHGDNDAIIPVEESRRLAAMMKGKPNFTYTEYPGGHHDTPLHEFDMAAWLRRYVAD